jgi:hypothetical protein
MGRRGLALLPHASAQPAQFPDHFVQSLALDKLHGVVVDALALADVEDRHDVGVMQSCRGACLTAEAQHALGVAYTGQGQHFESHVPIERLLLRLVNDAHAASANFADDAVVADPFERKGRSKVGFWVGACGAGLFHQQKRWKEVSDFISLRRQVGDVFAERRPLAAPVALQKIFRQLFHGIAPACRFRAPFKRCHRKSLCPTANATTKLFAPGDPENCFRLGAEDR